MSSPTDPGRLLRWSLRGNATFSTLSGATLMGAGASLATTFGVPEPMMLTSLGVNLLAFAAFLVWLASREEIRPALALAVVGADLAWVVGSVPVLLFAALTPAGNWSVAVVGNVVLAFAIAQFVGVRQLRPRATVSPS